MIRVQILTKDWEVFTTFYDKPTATDVKEIRVLDDSTGVAIYFVKEDK